MIIIMPFSCCYTNQVVDHVESVIRLVLWVNLPMLLLPHVVSECGLVPEGPLTEQTLHAEGREGRKESGKITRRKRLYNSDSCINILWEIRIIGQSSQNTNLSSFLCKESRNSLTNTIEKVPFSHSCSKYCTTHLCYQEAQY